jgi:hypothetical protein
MKVLYKASRPVLGVVGGLVAGEVFRRVWAHVADEADPPDATDRNRTWTEVLFAAALEGAIFGLVKTTIDRAGARSYHRLTGAWPDDD